MPPTGLDHIHRNLTCVGERIASACKRSDRPATSVRLVAVTKYAPIETVQALYDLGVRDFGESRPQAIWDRKTQFPEDVRWHLIGPWQTNKVRKTAPLIGLAHSMDRWPLAELVSAESIRCGRVTRVLCEVKLTDDEDKHGFAPEELRGLYSRLAELPGIEVRGLMAMASLDGDREDCRRVFRGLRELRDELRKAHPDGPRLDDLSMGMSNDFEIAIEEGATLVRIGSLLFEEA